MNRAAIREGMIVFSADGRALGRIVERDDTTLVIERGLFFKEDYVVDLADVARVEGDEVHLRLGDDEIEGDREYDRIGHRPAGGSPGPAGVILSAAEEPPAPSARACGPGRPR
jgi:hypothetical protein